MRLEVWGPRRREGAGGGRRLDPLCGPTAEGGEVALRPFLESRQRFMVEPRPDLRLPAAIETLDGGLEATFPRRRKHRGDPESETGAPYAADRVPPVMPALEDGVVVELSIGRQSERLPVLHEGVDRDFRGDQWGRPRAGQASVQRDAAEDLKLQAPVKRQPLNDVKTVQFGSALSDLGQVPAPRRWQPPNASLSVPPPPPPPGPPPGP